MEAQPRNHLEAMWGVGGSQRGNDKRVKVRKEEVVEHHYVMMLGKSLPT